VLRGAAVLVLAVGAARADDLDPPERVARVEIVEGAAAFQAAGTDAWNTDLSNRPFTTGDKLWVDRDARAEMSLGATAIRMGAQTAMQLLNVGDRATQLGLTGGSLNLRVRYLSPDETFEVDTPNLAVTIQTPGEYRIDVDDTGTITDVAALNGQVGAIGQSQDFTLQPGQFGEFRGTGELAPTFEDLPAPDAFDQWAQQLDQREDQSLTANFVSRDVTGYEDLDSTGTWATDPDEGPVWVPQVDPGWAPYSQGSWAWIDPWGWTWIDAAPWGFAPFHYGRWTMTRAGWAWAPGRLAVRPVYAPALVAWVGGAQFGVGGTAVAWFPLGLNELYRPAYPASASYLRNINVTNTDLDPTALIDARAGTGRRFVNQSVPGAVSSESRDAFVSATVLARAGTGRASPSLDAQAFAQALAKAPASTAQVPVGPTPRSMFRDANPGAHHVAAALAARADARFALGVTARGVPPAVRVQLHRGVRAQSVAVRLVAAHGTTNVSGAAIPTPAGRAAEPAGRGGLPAATVPRPSPSVRTDRPAGAGASESDGSPRESRPTASHAEDRPPAAQREAREEARAPVNDQRRPEQSTAAPERVVPRSPAAEVKPKDKPANKPFLKPEPR
jgi:hypothetical protein